MVNQALQFIPLMCSVMWLLSLKVAAVLAEDSVREAAKKVTPESVGSDEKFFPLVFEPCMELARKQMPILSSGWGRGAFLGSSKFVTVAFVACSDTTALTARLAVLCWSASFSKFQFSVMSFALLV